MAQAEISKFRALIFKSTGSNSWNFQKPETDYHSDACSCGSLKCHSKNSILFSSWSLFSELRIRGLDFVGSEKMYDVQMFDVYNNFVIFNWS